ARRGGHQSRQSHAATAARLHRRLRVARHAADADPRYRISDLAGHGNALVDRAGPEGVATGHRRRIGTHLMKTIAFALLVLSHVDAYRNAFDSFAVDVELTSTAPDGHSENSKFRVYGKGSDRSIAEFTAPPTE